MLKKTYRFRLLFLVMVSIGVLAAIEARLVHLQIHRQDYYKTFARRQQNKKIVLKPRRGDILDRTGSQAGLLATSYICDTIILDTRKVQPAPKGFIADLARVLHKPELSVRQMFEKPRQHILVRKAPEDIREAIGQLDDQYNLPPEALFYQKDSKRLYPNGTLAGQIIGYTKIDDSGDNIGLSGLELQYDKWLKGNYKEARVPVSCARGDLAPLPDEAIEATYGNNLVLTLDREIQMFTQRALRKRCGEMQALGGVAVVMEVETGRILALANCPDFDPNEFGKATPNQRKNRALTDPFEIGSVMKIITTALLLDRGLVSPEEMIDCKGGFTIIDGRRVTDAHKMGVVPFRHAFAESSNIGLITAGLRLEPSIYYEGLCRFGLGTPTGLDLPGEGSGVLYPLEKWTRLSRSSLPMGYECSLTPLQVISALQAIGNFGQRMKPHIVQEIRSPKGRLVKEFQPQPVERIASEKTCRTLLELMEAVVLEGTAKGHATVPGYRIGGKTGTTVKDKNATPKTYYASFAGLLPIQAPKLAIYVYVDEPQGAKYGGEVAAPIFSEIAAQAAHIMGIPPDDPAAYVVANQAPAPATAAQAALPEDWLAVDGEPILPMAEEATSVTAPTEAVAGTPMPSLEGLTMLQACEAVSQAGIQAKLLGSGIVVHQEPPAGQPLPEGERAMIVFAHPSEAGRTLVAEPALGPATPLDTEGLHPDDQPQEST